MDPIGKIGKYQGFGITSRASDGFGNIKTEDMAIISNEECYKNFNTIITTTGNGFNQRFAIKSQLYDGITDQLLCAEGLTVERERCRGSGKRKRCRARKFLTVSITTPIF